jgi:hypothetical protein
MERETTNQAPNLTSHAQEKIKKKKEKKRKFSGGSWCDEQHAC